MLYKITNTSDTKLSLEPPSLLSPGKSVTREYPPGIFPRRVENFQKHGMIEVCPVVKEYVSPSTVAPKVLASTPAVDPVVEAQLPLPLPEVTVSIPSIEVLEPTVLDVLQVNLKDPKKADEAEPTDLLTQLKSGKVNLTKEELKLKLDETKRTMLIKMGSFVKIKGALKYGKEELVSKILAKVETKESPTKIAEE